MKRKRKGVVKLNLTLSSEFYEVLVEKANADYMKTATWTRRFLMKSLDKNNLYVKSLIEDEK
jgi:hypothetical protein